MYRKDPFLTLI